jgi:hypothetical protein
VHRGTAEAQDEGGVKPFMCLCVYVFMCLCVYVFMCLCVYVFMWCLLFTNAGKGSIRQGCQVFFRHGADFCCVFMWLCHYVFLNES